MPLWIFWVALGWLVVLLAVFVVYQLSEVMRAGLPMHLGRLPVGTLWFGGIGGSVVSFTGIFWHNRDWDESYTYWHALRPLIGAITGGVGCLLLLVTTELATSGSKAMNPDIYYAAAFLVGFAEATFRDLIKRLTDVLFGPGKTDRGAPVLPRADPADAPRSRERGLL